MREKIKKFMDEPLTMRRCLKWTAIAYGGVAALLAINVAVDKIKEVREKHKLERDWNNTNDMYIE